MLAGSLSVLLASCTSLKPTDFAVGYKDVSFSKVSFDDIVKPEADSWKNAYRAFSKSCKTGMGSKAVWKDVCSRLEDYGEAAAENFFKENFDPWKIARKEGKELLDEGLMTSYYEPMLYGSRHKTKRYSTPLLGVPGDLVTVDLGSLYPSVKGLNLKGKVLNQRLVPYDTRREMTKRPELNAYAICWVDNPTDAFFLQIQGSGRVRLEDGSFIRVGYANSNGHPYRAISQWLIRNAGMKASEMSMQRIKSWVKANPKKRQELFNYNPNYVFFTERFGYADDEGPVGSQGVPLTALGSVAVDRSYWSLGTPFIVEADQPFPSFSMKRVVVAQDTGGAIKGAIRFDYFWGYGPEAGNQAGKQKSRTKAWVLVPRGHTPNNLK